MSQGEMSSRQLEVTVLSQKAWNSPVMGQVSRVHIFFSVLVESCKNQHFFFFFTGYY
jgi:hypothetical protein